MSDKKPDDDLIGQTIAGRYRIISCLGAGGMGVAYRAWAEEGGVPIVIKIPKKAVLDDPKFAERFAREIRLLQGLRHPHIVPIVDVGQHEGLPYVAMRFLPGGSLSNRRLRDEDGKPRPNPTGMLHLWLPAIADALDHVHANGVVHRDVKPGNIFFDAYWNAFLGDFGIAKIVEESDSFDREHTLTATNMGIGTQEYMGPEQFTPKPLLDGRTDQYALAVMAYEMLAGTRPFTGTTAHLIVEVTTQPVPRLDRAVRGLPSSLVEAVHQGLAKSPGERFPTCREFAAAVLRDVEPLADEPDIARLLCPNCSNILKLPVNAAGRKGKCPKCKTEMKVAADLGALWLLGEARRQKKSTASVIDADPRSDSSDSGSLSPEDSLQEFQPVSGTTPVGWARRQSWSSIFTWINRHGLAVAGVITILTAALWLVGGAGNDRQPDLDRRDAEIRRLSEQLSEQGKQLESVSKAKEEAQTPLAAARTDLEATQPEAQELKTLLDASLSPPIDRLSLPADAQEILAQRPLENSIGIKFKLIPAGTFMMGSNRGGDDEKPVHEVRITKPFYIGVFEVTNAQWKVVMGSVPSRWKDDDMPVDTVSWNNAVSFCRKLSEMPGELKAGRVYRLPTEAEWEYACRASTTTRWSFGDNENQVGDFAWFSGNAGDQTHRVGAKKPNAWGLYDMHGNLMEWCADRYGPYPGEAVTDPAGFAQGSSRVFRGGCWSRTAGDFQSADRDGLDPSSRGDFLGFRLALSPSDSTPPEAGQPGGSKAEPATGGASPSGQDRITKNADSVEILARPPVENSIGMKLKLIPPGTFMMGSEDGEVDEKPVHEVRITKPFYLGVYEVTNAQWKRVMGGKSPSEWKEDDRPVENVSWTDAVAFCQKLSGMPEEEKAGRVYRLPTEAEWEYACRAGTTTK